MDYRVALDIYKGPLDLLLYLIQESEVDIYDIPIAEITDQYMKHLEIIQMLDPNLAGDFLVMASTLMEIKSRMLLPKPETPEGEEEEGDPRIELIRQLMEYKRFKEAAALLAERREEQMERFGRGARQKFEGLEDDREELEMSEVTVWDVLAAFDRVMRQTLRLQPATIVDRDVPVRQHIEHILRMLRIQGLLTFLTLFETCEDRIEAIGMLLALLEMTRARVIGLSQTADRGEITIRLVNEENVPKLLQEVTETRVRAEEGEEDTGEPEAHEAAPPEAETAEEPADEAPTTEPAEAPPESAPAEENDQDETDEDLDEIRKIEIHDVHLAEESTDAPETAPGEPDAPEAETDPEDGETT